MPARAMILAAGRGERMRPLTDTRPKPLLEVRGKALIDWHVDALADAGIDRIAVNAAWLEEEVVDHFAAPRAGLRIDVSREGRDFGGALETAGGIVRALPMLADPFWVVAGDVFAPGFEFTLEALDRFGASGMLAHAFLVPNPGHNPGGDFGLAPGGHLTREGVRPWTYSTIGLYRHEFFSALPAGNPQGVKAAMLPLMIDAIARGRMTGEPYPGPWTDVGTPERLAALNAPVD